MDPQVSHPSHYKRGVDDYLAEVRAALLEDHEKDIENLECIEAMLSMFDTVDQIRGYLRGNSFKYRWRYRDKGGIQSMFKAKWYEKKLELLEEVSLKYT